MAVTACESPLGASLSVILLPACSFRSRGPGPCHTLYQESFTESGLHAPELPAGATPGRADTGALDTAGAGGSVQSPHGSLCVRGQWPSRDSCSSPPHPAWGCTDPKISLYRASACTTQRGHRDDQTGCCLGERRPGGARRREGESPLGQLGCGAPNMPTQTPSAASLAKTS